MHALGPNEKTISVYFQGPKGSIDEKIWAVVREVTRANIQRPTPPKPTMGR